MVQRRAYRRFKIREVSLLPHSRLYSLEPVGVGTPYVESLTGYLARLAQAHGSATGVLFTREVAPHLGQTYLTGLNGEITPNAWKLMGVQALNGFGVNASNLVTALEKLTLRSELACMTLLTWEHVLQPCYVLRRARAWCPACYEEWRNTGGIIYEPLLWALRQVDVCLRHEQSLLLSCPQCGEQLPILGLHSRPGYCSRCLMWLGSAPARRAGSMVPGQVWLANVLGELTASAIPNTLKPQREIIAATLIGYVEALCWGNVGRFASYVNVNGTNLRSWIKGTTLPRLDLLLRICQRLNVTPLNMFLGKVDVNIPGEYEAEEQPQPSTGLIAAVDPEAELINKLQAALNSGEDKAVRNVLKQHRNDLPSWRSISARTGYGARALRRCFPESYRFLIEQRDRARNAHWREVEKSLEDAVERVPIIQFSEIARQFGCNSRSLYRKFPRLCHKITERYAEHIKARSRERETNFHYEVECIVTDLTRQGIYPSYRRVYSLLSKPVFNLFLAHKIIRETRNRLYQSKTHTKAA